MILSQESVDDTWCWVYARKIIRRMEDLSEVQATLKPDLLELFQNLYNQSNKFSTFCVEVRKWCLFHLV